MKSSRDQATRNRERVVEAATRMFRREGFEGTGLAPLMRSVGLTHGAFYAQFGSKIDLAIEACQFAFARSKEAWTEVAELNPGWGLAATVARDLNPAHLDEVDNACAAVILACTLAHGDPEIRRILRSGIDELALLLGGMFDDATEEDATSRAKLVLSSMVGAVLIALAVDEERFSGDLLAEVGGGLMVFAGLSTEVS